MKNQLNLQNGHLHHLINIPNGLLASGQIHQTEKNRVKLELQMAFIPTPKVNHEEAQRWSYVSIP